MIRTGTALLAAGTLLAGCASQTALLLPGEPGHPVGALAVLGKKGETVLDQANEAASLSAGGASLKRNVAVKPEYATLIGSLPPPAVPFTLQYENGADLPAETPGNLQTIDDIKTELANRPGAEVQVTGFTDRVGSEEANLALSQKRAEKFRLRLLAAGLQPDQVSAIGRGELDPVEPTDDNVASEKNRRIVVIVR